MIAGLGTAIPGRSMDSAETERQLGLEPGWIEQRTGIRSRRIADPDQATSDLAVPAAEAALADAGVDPVQIGLVLLATSTPDHLLPPTAPTVAHRLACFGAGAIDLAGACTGFVAALILGDAYAASSDAHVLVVAANVLSRRTDPTDAATNALFGDGAGSVVIDPNAPNAILGSAMGSKGQHAEAINIPAGGSRSPITLERVAKGEHLMHVNRGSLMAHEAITGMADIGTEALKSAGLSIDDVDLWVPHQAGRRIIEGARERLGVPAERTVDVVADLGNSSAATIPIAMQIAREHGRLERGMTVLLTSVGAGIVSASAVVKW